MRTMIAVSLGAMLGAAILASSCGGNGVTTPTTTTTTTTTTTVAEPTIRENFSGTLAVGPSRFYSFSVSQNGTVNVTLTSLGGSSQPSDVTVGLSVGTPSGTGCSTPSTVTVSAASTAQVTGTYSPGIYCARIFDVGNLPAPVAFAITIAHP